MIELCIPTYNESAVIAESVHTVQEALKQTSLEWRILVADNGSTDNTVEVIEALRVPGVQVISIKERGKGAALIAAAQTSKADIFGFIDADLSADPAQIEEFVRHITDSNIDIVIGSRLLDKRLVQRGSLRSLSSQLFNMLRRSMLGIKVVDSQCGFKVMNVHGRKLLAQCTEKGWFIDLEFLYRAEREGLTILELPIHWSENRLSGHTSKLRIVADGFGALRAMWRIRSTVK